MAVRLADDVLTATGERYGAAVRFRAGWRGARLSDR